VALWPASLSIRALFSRIRSLYHPKSLWPTGEPLLTYLYSWLLFIASLWHNGFALSAVNRNAGGSTLLLDQTQGASNRPERHLTTQIVASGVYSVDSCQSGIQSRVMMRGWLRANWAEQTQYTAEDRYKIGLITIIITISQLLLSLQSLSGDLQALRRIFKPLHNFNTTTLIQKPHLSKLTLFPLLRETTKFRLETDN
jgi:hypothetical protein